MQFLYLGNAGGAYSGLAGLDGGFKDLPDEALVGYPLTLRPGLDRLQHGAGRRVLTRSVLRWNSKRTRLKPDKSYSVRSALATKSSAFLSVLTRDFLFHGAYFYIVMAALVAAIHVVTSTRSRIRKRGTTIAFYARSYRSLDVDGRNKSTTVRFSF